MPLLSPAGRHRCGLAHGQEVRSRFLVALLVLAGCHGNVTVGHIDCRHWSEQWHVGPWLPNGRCRGCMTRHDYAQGIYACATLDGDSLVHFDNPFSPRVEAPLSYPSF